MQKCVKLMVTGVDSIHVFSILLCILYYKMLAEGCTFIIPGFATSANWHMEVAFSVNRLSSH